MQHPKELAVGEECFGSIIKTVPHSMSTSSACLGETTSPG